MTSMDVTIVNVAGPSIEASLYLSADLEQRPFDEPRNRVVASGSWRPGSCPVGVLFGVCGNVGTGQELDLVTFCSRRSLSSGSSVDWLQVADELLARLGMAESRKLLRDALPASA